MEKPGMFVVIGVSLLIIAELAFLWYSAMQPNYSCSTDSDCVHTCGAKCANKDWAANYNDPCVNVRAYMCTCVNSTCYSDGNPPR